MLPARAAGFGFSFLYPELDAALAEIVGRRSAPPRRRVRRRPEAGLLR